MFTTSSPVNYSPAILEDDIYVQHCQMFEEYFKRVMEEEEASHGDLFNAHVALPAEQTRRISVPVHRLSVQHQQDFQQDSKGQRRSQSLRHSGREVREKFGNSNKGGESFKSPSAPESRACSYRDKKQRWRTQREDKPTKKELNDEVSMEDPVEKKLQLVKMMQGLDCTVVRTFSTSSRGIINRGDSFRRKQPPAAPIVHIEPTETPHVQLLARFPAEEINPPKNFSTFQPTPRDLLRPPCSNKNPSVRKVLVMGDHGVGKTSLLQQFITSEYMGTADPVFDNELEKTVSVQVDDFETTVTFVDLPKEAQKECTQLSDMEAFIVCYSTTDRRSFNFAVDLLEDLKSRQRFDAAVILVANKSDLVRTRKVSFEEGKSVCQKFNYKFIEVSAAFNHCVDDLLVGLVHQIRLNPKRERAKSVPNTGSSSSTEALLTPKSSLSFGCFKGAKLFFTEFLFGSKKTKSRSCDNLWTL